MNKIFLFFKMLLYQLNNIYISKKLQNQMDLKSRYELEFPINSSPQLLYQYISTPSGLSEWFADNAVSYTHLDVYKRQQLSCLL